MIETPTLTDSPEQATACISLVVPRSEIQSVMGPAIGEMMSALLLDGAELNPQFGLRRFTKDWTQQQWDQKWS